MSDYSNPRWFRTRRRISIFLPLLLIGVGVILLLNNMNALKWDVWDIVFLGWPILLVAGGLDGLVQGENPVWQAFWMGAGAMLLLANFGYLQWNSWDIVVRLWPLVLVAAGVSIFSRDSRTGAFVGAGVVVVLMGGAIWLLVGAPARNATQVAGQSISHSLEGATASNVYLEMPAGLLRVRAMVEPQGQLSGTVSQPASMTLDPSFRIEDGTAYAALRGSGMGVWLPFTGSRDQYIWDMRLNPAVPLTLTAKSGAGEMNVDLTGMTMNSARLNFAVGVARLVLPAEGRFDVRLDGAVGDVTVVVPRGMQVRLRADTALVTVQVPGSYAQDDKVYTSPGVDRAESLVELSIDLAIGRVTVREEGKPADGQP